jgi:hypothetical protein
VLDFIHAAYGEHTSHVAGQLGIDPALMFAHLGG